MEKESQKPFLIRRITWSCVDTGIIVISGMHKTCLLILAEVSSKYWLSVLQETGRNWFHNYSLTLSFISLDLVEILQTSGTGEISS